MGLKLTDNVERPSYNTTVGVPIKVKTNHFKIENLPSQIIQQWAVEFVTERPPPKAKAALMRRNKELWSLPAVQNEFKSTRVIYNGGGIAYTAGKLAFDQLSKVIVEDNNTKIKMVKSTTINPETLPQFLKKKYAYDENVFQVVNFLDALISDTPRKTFPTVFGTSQFFDPVDSRNVFDLGGGAQLWRGIFQSARPGPGYMTINVDVAHTAFYRPHVTVVDLLVENLNLQSAAALAKLKDDPRRKREAAKLLSSVGVYTKHTKRRDGSNRPEKVFQVLWNETPMNCKFEKDGKMVSIAQYFREAYNIALKYPAFPLLEMSGSKSKVPMELCHIASGQRFPNSLLTGQQTAEIVRQAAQPPAERLASIEHNIKTLEWRSDPSLVQYGLQASTTGIVANARLLDSPSLAYAANQTVKPKDGKYNPTGKKSLKSNKICSWGILKFTGPRDDTSQFEREIVNSGARYGIQFEARTPHVEVANPHGNVTTLVQNFWQTTGNKFKKMPQILFFIIPAKGDLYGEIKMVCDTRLGVPSQCIASNNLRKANAQYCDNVWLKVNPKTGGLNNQLVKNAFAGPTLLLGADVSHPPAGALAGNSPSIASLVSNNDLNANTFVGQARSQPARAEIIEELEGLVKNAVRAYMGNKTANPKGLAPKTILYYRDGVGENQFEEVRVKELVAIKNACRDLKIDAKITVVICQKRHHTRLFPTSANQGDRLGNGEIVDLHSYLPELIVQVKAGTVVDNDITHPVDFDFFLVAHTSFKGTARPTHYNVIFDENKFKPEVLQKLTNDLCYTFARSTTAVSLVPVAYYAHLVGNRVKAYCNGGSDNASQASGTTANAMLPPLSAKLRECMWFI